MQSAQASNALKVFSIENGITVCFLNSPVTNCQEDVDFYDTTKDDDLNELDSTRPWDKNPNYFKKAVVSAQALIKMVSHTSRGGTIEVMGLLQGRIRGDTFLITDCFPLPVEGTETRVNAGEAANEFMVAFTELNEQTRFSSEPVVGWYHSHPGYGCWLSGIDVATQLLYQSHQDPFLAIVIDPLRTEALGRVDIGAFRVYPDSYSPPDTKESRSDIPIEKVQDFGVHCKRYYPLEVSFNKSKFDQVVIDRVWADHWAHMISSSDWLDVKRRYFQDLNRASNALDPEDPESIRRFAKNVEQCSCKFIAETVFEQLKQRVFAPIGERMDTSS